MEQQALAISTQALFLGLVFVLELKSQLLTDTQKARVFIVRILAHEPIFQVCCGVILKSILGMTRSSSLVVASSGSPVVFAVSRAVRFHTSIYTHITAELYRYICIDGTLGFRPCNYVFVSPPLFLGYNKKYWINQAFQLFPRIFLPVCLIDKHLSTYHVYMAEKKWKKKNVRTVPDGSCWTLFI